MSIGELGEADMAALFDRWSPVVLDPSRFPSDTWRTLMAEDGLLRVVKHGHLESVPQDFSTTTWSSTVRIVGRIGAASREKQ